MGDFLGFELILLFGDSDVEVELFVNESLSIVVVVYLLVLVVWVVFVEGVLVDDKIVMVYVYVCIGYYCGLDQLCCYGWKGFGLVLYFYQFNWGFLWCVVVLVCVVVVIGEIDEYGCCLDLFDDCDFVVCLVFGF